MMLKSSLSKISGLRYVVDSLDLSSSLSRQCILETPFYSDAETLNAIYDKIDAVRGVLNDFMIDNLRLKLSQVKDIRATVKSLANNYELYDPELFELKHFALLANDISGICSDLKLDVVSIADLSGVVKILDPDATGSATFYVYDSYDESLRLLRKQLKAIKTVDQQTSETWREIERVETQIRGRLVDALKPYAKDLESALYAVSDLDILIAKALQSEKLGLTRAVISGNTSFKQLFNIQMKALLESEKKTFQKVDITLGDFPTLITGANMAGKTVLLKSLAVATAMSQYGFFTPAACATLKLVDEIILIVGDEQDETRGLSSFAAEILNINRAVKEIKKGRHVMLLVDEPARTTNPVEGAAIVDALIDIIREHKTMAVISTHYGNLQRNCKRLRVKGFVYHDGQRVTKDNIGQYIDYSLEEVFDSSVPHEALRIAEILEIDEEIIKRAKKYAEK